MTDEYQTIKIRIADIALLYINHGKILYRYDWQLSYILEIILELDLDLVVFFLTIKYFCKLYNLVKKDNVEYVLILLVWLSDTLSVPGDYEWIKFKHLRKYFNGSCKSKAKCLEDMIDIFGLLDFDYEPREVINFNQNLKINYFLYFCWFIRN